MNETVAQECPSRFALDDRALHGGGDVARGAIVRHLESCPRCQATLADRAAERTLFDATAGALWTRIAARGRARRRRRWIALPASIAALGAVALVIAARGPIDRGYVGPKGAAPIEIVCRRAGAAFALGPGDEVAAGDELRFKPLPVRPGARFIQIGSVDGTGRYTPFYPSVPGASGVPLPDAGQALDGSIRLDDAPGPERLFVVLSATPLSEAAVRQVAAPGSTVDRIDGVPVTSAWIVLRKRIGAPPP